MDEIAEQELGEKAAHILYPLFIGQFFGIIFTAITFIVVARLLGPFNYGIYIFAFGFSTLVNGFAGFGIGAYFSNILAKFAYKKESEGMLRALMSGYIIAFAIGIILTLIGLGMSGYVASIFPNVGITSMDLMLASATIIFILINAISVSALIGLSRTGLGAINTTLVDLIQLVLSAVLIMDGYGVEGAIIAMLIGYIVGAVSGLYFVYIAASKHISFRLAMPPLSRLWEIFVYVTPVAWTNFLNTGMQNFSILYLGLFVSTAYLGNYGAASKGLALITMVYSALSSGLFPIFTTAKAMDSEISVNSTYNKIIRFAMLIMLPIVVFVGVMAQPGLLLLVTQSYKDAWIYLALIAAGTTLGLFGGYVNNLIISEGFTKSVLKVNLISAVIQLVAMVLLVPWLHTSGGTANGDLLAVVGAVLTIFFLGNIIEAWLFAIEAKKLFGIKFEYRHLILLYVANALFAVILFALYSSMSSLLVVQSATLKAVLEIAISLIVAIVIYPPILVVLRALSLHDIRSMRHATMRLGRGSMIFATFFDYSERVYLMLMGA